MTAQELKTRLESKGLTISFAESCTSGMAMSMLASLQGASAVLLGGVVVYSNDLKVRMLDIDVSTLEEKGAVSEEVATAMARRVRELTGSDLGVAISGIAGPAGGSEEKPVGLVYIAASDGRHTVCERRRFQGGREDIRISAAERSIELSIEVLEME